MAVAMEEASQKIPDTVKLQKAKDFKAQGNEAYKSKKIRQAIGKYHRALLHLKGIGQTRESLTSMFVGHDEDTTHPIPPEMISEVGSLQADCFNNLAGRKCILVPQGRLIFNRFETSTACLLQQDDPNFLKVIDYCDNVLAIQPGNVKAVYRKGQALYNLKSYDKALDVFSQADGDPSVKKYTIMCKREIEKQEKQLKAAYRGMFDKLSSDSKSSSKITDSEQST